MDECRERKKEGKRERKKTDRYIQKGDSRRGLIGGQKKKGQKNRVLWKKGIRR